MPSRPLSPVAVGWVLALLSSAAFGASGVLAKSLLATGWTPAAAVAWRVALAALVLALPAVLQLRGRWSTLRRGWPSVVLFGLLAVAGCQLTYFMAIERLPVSLALLVQYQAIVLVVGWLWLRHGQRPRRLTLVGVVVAVLGLVLILDIFGATGADPVGVLWALISAVGLAAYFIMAADQRHGVPSLALASGGLVTGALVLLLVGASGLLPLRWSTADVQLAGLQLPWWGGLLALSLVSTACAYAAGIVSARRLGSKLASFLGLFEMLFAVLWAFLLLRELPTPLQALGGALIFGGVMLVKLDERGGPAA